MLSKLFLSILVIAIFVAGFFLSQNYLKSLPIASSISKIIVNKEGCDEDCRKIISEEVNKAIATISAVKKTTVVTSSAPAAKQTQFISLDGNYSTTNTDWVDVPGTEVGFDLNKNYSSNAKVSWQATLNVANSNGQTFARLFDITHGIAVSGSEISTTNNADFKTAYSGNLNLWSGHINYKVQIKSLNSFNVSYAGGKIKIEY